MELLRTDDPRRRDLDSLPLRAGGADGVDVAALGGRPLPSRWDRMEAAADLPGRSMTELAEELLGGQVQERAGLHVAATTARLEVGTRMLLTLRVGPLRIAAPCLVIEVREAPGLVSFTYATLEGHPEQGLERFTIATGHGGVPVLTISAVSTPALWWVRLGGPFSHRVQRRTTARYLAALRTCLPASSRR